MKTYFLILLLTICQVVLAQTPSKPTNPFPTNRPTTPPSAPKPAPTQKPPTTLPVPSSVPSVPAPPTTSSPSTSPVPTNPSPGSILMPITGSDEEQIFATISRVFDAMRLKDSMMAKPLFTPTCKLFTPNVNASGIVTIQEETVSSFLKAISTPRKQVVDERILKYKLDIDGPLANVWVDYNLYVDNNFIHCGVDVFQLYKSNEGWKIFSLADTRRKTGCLNDPKVEVSTLLDKWHMDAAAANGDAYFGAMTPDGVFLGTDATERWTREEFRTWAKPQFDAKKGWNFKTSKRNISLTQDNAIAWFDEELSTWMGPCRGSGVLAKTVEGWKIKQYNLTILVPNEKVQDYLKVLGLK